MPVVQLVHPSLKDKLNALRKEIPIKFHNRNAILEPKKESIVRCYHCQRFGHVARVCSYTQRCECCSRSDHLGRCALLQSSAVQIAQVNTEVLPRFVPYFFSMPVNTDQQQSANFRISTLNCQSWNTAKRGISNLLDFYKIGLFCLSETWETEANPINFRNWTVFSKRRQDGHGVAILCKPSEQFMVQRLETLADGVEAICIKVTTDTQDSFAIINAYIPPGETGQLRLLTGIVEKVEKDYKKLF